MRISFAGARSRFSHFLGFSAPAKKAKRAAAPGNDDEDEEKDYDKKGKKAKKKADADSPEHGEDGDEGGDSHMERDDDEDVRAESDDNDEEMRADDSDAGDDDEDDDDTDKDDDKKKKFKKKSKKAKRAAADEDDAGDDDDDKGSDKKASRGALRRARLEGYKRGRRAERGRWSNIFASRHSAGNLTLALRLASSTGLHSDDVIEQLRDVGGEAASARRERRNPSLGDMSGDEMRDGDKATAIAASWDKVMTKVAPVAHQASKGATLNGPRRGSTAH